MRVSTAIQRQLTNRRRRYILERNAVAPPEALDEFSTQRGFCPVRQLRPFPEHNLFRLESRIDGIWQPIACAVCGGRWFHDDDGTPCCATLECGSRLLRVSEYDG